ncbi:MAG: NAD(P)/FAD-dependent oxidoreductase, partial [Promethearchaeota archaeon]
LRILRNYAPIQPFFKDVKQNPTQMTPSDLFYGRGTREPMTQFVSNQGRVLVVGDAGGLLYALYFEGVIGAVASAQIAGEVLSLIFTQGKEYSKANLMAYEKELHRRLLDSYFKMGQISTEMFFKGGDKPPFTIWEAYLRAINELPQVRKNIWTAYRWDDLSNYPEKNDAWVGQEIYKRLPLGMKIAFTPFFLKLKF